MSTSKTKCKLNSSKDLKTYKRPLQPITKFFGPSSGSDEKPTVKLKGSPGLLDSTKGTLILQESPPDSSPNNSGVFQVTAKPTIDMSKSGSDLCLMNDHLRCPDLRPPIPREQLSEKVPNNDCKRTNNKSSKGPPAKKKKSEDDETQLQDKANTSAQPPSSNTEFLFEFSEDEDEKRIRLVNGDANGSKVYFCKHCDYSDVNIKHVSTHYQKDHPYIRYNAVYIQDPCDRSATFRCLQCPVEFLRVADLKRHYTENHPEGPNISTMHSSDLCLVFKCFVCPFTTNAVKELKDHYKERHPTHEVDNSLMYCRYSVTRCQEGPPQLSKCEKAPSPEKPEVISHENAHTSSEEVKNAPSTQHATSKRADMSVYHCNSCNFSHKSVVVMHVHYQKSHPDEAVTIDKIKQSVCVMSPTALQMTAEMSPKTVSIKEKSTPQRNISEEIPLSLANPTHTPEASKTLSASAQSNNLKSAEDRSKVKKSSTKRKREMFTRMDGLSSGSPNELFYCQFCSFSSTKVKGVVGHHNAKHATVAPINTEEVLSYSFEMRKKKLQSETEASTRTTTCGSKNSKQVEVYDKNERLEEVEAAYNPYACAEKLYFCQKCNYGNPSAQGVVNHQVKVHHNIRPNLEHVFKHTALIHDEIKKSKAKDSSFSSRLPLPLMVEGEEDVFFCHFCNYRHRTLKRVLWHYLQKHNGFAVKSEQVQRYTSMVLKETKKSRLKTTGQEVSQAFIGNKEIPKKKTKKLGKVSASPSTRALQTQRTLQCHRCPYSTQYVYMLRRHMWNVHKSNRSSAEVLRACFKRGHLETGYHCDLCVFSHSKAAAVYKHCQEQHPGRRLSLEYVSTRLYVGPEQTKPQTKQPDATDSCSSPQRSEQNENKTYSCRACSYKGSSLSSMTGHYRAFHPWSVKEDGSVLYLINNKKRNANRQVEEQNEMPQSFDTYQVPLEFEKSPGSSQEAASSQKLECPFCPAMFYTKHGFKTHCGMKHQGAAVENLDKEQEEQVQTQPRVHVFKCRHCTYVNTSYHGVLTHCQMRHPALESLADSLYVDEANIDNWEDCVKKKGPGLRLCGYMCKSCPQIYATQEKLSKHHEEEHESVASTLPKKSKSARELSAVNKNKHHKIHHHGPVSKTSFLSKNRHAVIRCQYCSYGCTTKYALVRHLQVRHKTSSVSKAQGCFYKCVLCSKLYFKKKRLGHHYANKHGKDAFLKYYAPFYKEGRKKPAAAVPYSHLTQHNTPEACESSTTAEENKTLVFKCPECPYVNASFHGTLTHCQMRHPELTARAEELQTDDIFVSNMVRCTLGKGSNVRGYMCKSCPQIHVSLKKLKIHCERDHNQAKTRPASKHSVECETEQQPDHSFQGSILEAFALKLKTSGAGTSEIGSSPQLDAHETRPSNSLLQDEKSIYKCHICAYAGSCRKYLYCHYKNTHKLDAYTTYKLLEKYNKYKGYKARHLAEAKSKEFAHVKCKMCPNLKFNSPQQLISHYSTLHLSDSILDFTVLKKPSKRTTGLYKCSLCKKQMNGIRILCYHLDRHRDTEKNSAKTAKASDIIMTTPPTKSIAFGEQDELPMLETVEDLAQWNVTPVETFTVPPSSPSLPSNPNDPEQPDLESKEDKLACKHCGRTFMSLKGLRSHERSHAALAAIKKQSTLSTSTLKHNINKYVIYKDGNLRPFLCSICSYRTTVLGLWRSHFMKKHRDVVMDHTETDDQDDGSADMANEEHPNSSDELNNLPELDNEPKSTGESLYLEPPDVQRQLNHYSLMVQASTISKTNVEEAKLPENSLLPCEFCNFNTGHLSSVRRHYLNRHGKKMLRCKDCNFFTGIRKTLEMHIDKGHSTCQSEPTHQKDLRCPFCLYQTKNKNNMIDHVVLHREERVVPIEVRRPKLSRYLQGLVFRCHKCTFTSGSAEMLRLHMMKHDDIKPYKCRLCYFDCTQLNGLEAHLNDKHQVMRNHELVGQVSLDQLEASVFRMPEEEAEHLSDMEHHNDSEDIKTEEFDTHCNKVLHDTQAKNPAENNIRENTLMIKEVFQSEGQDGKNGNEERPSKCSVLDLQYDDKKTITTVQDKQVQDTQEQEETVFSSQYEDCNCPERYGQTNKNQPKLRAGEDSSMTFTQLKQRSTTSGNALEEAQAHKLHLSVQKHRTMNVEDRIEDDILRHVLQLDEDGSYCKMHKKSDQDKTVKMEQNIEPEVTGNVFNRYALYDEQGSITMANNQQIQVQTNAISTSAKTNHSEANKVRAQDPLTFERNLLTLGPNFGQLKISHKGILGVSFRKCSEKQIHSQNKSTEVRGTYGEMPVLEKERLKEEMHPVSCCKEEDQSNQSDQKEANEEEMAAKNVKEEEGDGIKKAENLHVPEGAVSDGETTQEKLFTCEFCGRNLINSSELEHHIIRHGI